MTSEELRQKRQKMGLTQNQLSGLMGMHNGAGEPEWRSVSRLERGKRAPTNKDAAAVKNLMFIFEHGLLPELLRRGR